MFAKDPAGEGMPPGGEARSWRSPEMLSNALQVGLTLVDVTAPDLPLVFVNDAFTQMTGYAREDVIGRNCRFLQGPETSPESIERLRSATLLREAATVEMVNYRADGSRFWNLVSIAPLPDAEGQITRMVGVQRDITPLKVRQRADEAQQRLVALEHLAGGMAHDFNNVLSVVLGCASLLAGQTRHPPEDQELLKAIQMAATRGRDLVRGLLSMTHAPRVVVESIDLAALFSELQLLVATRLKPGVRLTCTVDPSARWTQGDATQLASALMNLVLNADQAIGETGDIRIESRLKRSEADERVLISVEDTGSGMDADVLARIFDPFFSTRRGRGGHGLGLTMVHASVRNVGGTVSVESTPGAGSRFLLDLPAGRPDLAAAQPERSPTQPVGMAGSVVLVEDDDTLRLIAQTMLQALGLSVTTFSDGDAAIASLSTGLATDFLCTDCELGGRATGMDVAQAYRAKWPELPIVLMSGRMRPDLDPSRHELFLSKPFTLDQLAAALAHAEGEARRPSVGALEQLRPSGEATVTLRH